MGETNQEQGGGKTKSLRGEKGEAQRRRASIHVPGIENIEKNAKPPRKKEMSGDQKEGHYKVVAKK